MKLSKFTIYGERCTGTNYLENLVLKNFDVDITWEFGWKHFFGFHDNKLLNSDDTLFICIIRDPIDWINSFFREKHHLPLKYMKNLTEEEKIYKFLNDEFWSFNDNNGNRDTSKEILVDRNIYTGDRYKNIFELRYTKNNFLLKDMPKKVKNYIFIRYEDLKYNLDKVMKEIKNKGLPVKTNIKFPLNVKTYKKTEKSYEETSKKKKNIISDDVILNHPEFKKFSKFERLLGYI